MSAEGPIRLASKVRSLRALNCFRRLRTCNFKGRDFGYPILAPKRPQAITLGGFQILNLRCATVSKDFAAGHEAAIF